nr:methylmalonyl-CoA mutase family protein [Polyangiaceae bacterium]
AKALGLIEEIESVGGMTRAVESGMPKLRIEEAAARRQARIDRGLDVIVGVNKYAPEADAPIDARFVDNSMVRKNQLERLAEIKRTRSQAKVDATLQALQQAAETGSGNLLEYCVDAARARATVGEISDAMERAFGRHQAEIQSISGVYGGYYADDPKWLALRTRVADFEKQHGRRPRIMVAKMGQDGHDRGAKLIATAFADAGYDVDVGPLFQTPAEAARQAVENDVHAIGVSSQAAGHTTLVPALIAELAKLEATEITIVVGGVIPPSDYPSLEKMGVGAVFGPGTPVPVAAERVLSLVEARHKKG